MPRMAFESLTSKEQEIVLRCLKATTGYIDDCEKHSRLGLEPDELQGVIERWPHIDDSTDGSNGFLAINNCLNEVCHGFRIHPDDWNNWFDVTESEIKVVYEKWLRLRGLRGGIR
jgi:hypothetical protein